MALDDVLTLKNPIEKLYKVFAYVKQTFKQTVSKAEFRVANCPMALNESLNEKLVVLAPKKAINSSYIEDFDNFFALNSLDSHFDNSVRNRNFVNSRRILLIRIFFGFIIKVGVFFIWYRINQRFIIKISTEQEQAAEVGEQPKVEEPENSNQEGSSVGVERNTENHRKYSAPLTTRKAEKKKLLSLEAETLAEVGLGGFASYYGFCPLV